MRVILNTLHLVSENLGGAWVYTWQLAKALERHRPGLEVIVLANENTADRFRSLGHQVHTAPVDSRNRLRRVAWEQLSLAGELRRYGADVFHATGNVLPLRLPMRSVLTLHDCQWHYYPANFSAARRTYLRAMVRASARRADHVICISEATRKDARVLCGVPERNMSVVYEAGLDSSEAGLAVDAADLRSRYGVTRPVLLSVGSSLPHKNLERLILAFKEIVAEIPHDLLIVGESFGHHDRLAGLVGKVLSEYGARIRFTGYVSRSDLVGLYRLADAFVFPSLFEGFGIPAVEAMELGTPVIASSATSLPEVVGDAGEYFDPASVPAMASAVKRVCLDEGLRKSLAALGAQRARMFSWDAMADRTYEVYNSILHNQR
jgi:glycosyltransferase involved in cell wall biosynthesis